MPCANKSPLIRFTCVMRSAIKVRRSRHSLRRSSSSGEGATTIAQDPWLTAFVRQKRPQQCLAIQPVRLGPPAPARCRNRGRVDHVALDPLLLQHAVDPEPIQARLLDRNHRIVLAGSRLRLAFEVCKQLEKLRSIASRDAVFGHLLALAGRKRRHQPIRTTQFQRYEDCAKLRADSGRSVGRMIKQHRSLSRLSVSATSVWPQTWLLSTPHGIFATLAMTDWKISH